MAGCLVERASVNSADSGAFLLALTRAHCSSDATRRDATRRVAEQDGARSELLTDNQHPIEEVRLPERDAARRSSRDSDDNVTVGVKPAIAEEVWGCSSAAPEFMWDSLWAKFSSWVSSVFPCESPFYRCSVLTYQCPLKCAIAISRQHSITSTDCSLGAWSQNRQLESKLYWVRTCMLTGRTVSLDSLRTSQLSDILSRLHSISSTEQRIQLSWTLTLGRDFGQNW
jgi:hypothetical protein